MRAFPPKILQAERQRRNAQVAALEQQMNKAEMQIFRLMKQYIAHLAQRGLKINAGIIERQFALMQHGETLTELVNRHYSPADAECAKICNLREGREKRNKWKAFGDDILRKSIEAYFSQLSTACDMVFFYIEDATKHKIVLPNEQYEILLAEQQQKEKIQNTLQEIERIERLLLVVRQE